MTAFRSKRPAYADPAFALSAAGPDLAGIRRVRIQVTRTRVIETSPARAAKPPRADGPSAFTRTRFLASMKDFTGLAVMLAGGYVFALVV